jgi:anti-sigma factor ChrR (cupin superfamily)
MTAPSSDVFRGTKSHAEIEQTFVIDGSFYDHNGICRAGDFVWRRVG